MENKKDQLKRNYGEIIRYIVFGVMTTLVNFVIFYIMEKVSPGYLVNNIIAWVGAVIFAYVTNKIFVFRSSSWDLKLLLREIGGFFGARVFSLAVEEAGMWLFVDILGFGSKVFSIFGMELTGTLISKVIFAVIVIIMNYFFSKFIIFAKSKKS